MPRQLEKPDSLVGTAPDPERDKDALCALQDPGSPQAKELAERLLSNGGWNSSPLGRLLPGLPLIDAPNFSIRLSVRAANPVLKADLSTLRELAMRAPVDILGLPGLGKGTVEEILATVISEWAAAYLGEGDKSGQGAPTRPSDPPDRREQLRRLSDAFDQIEEAPGFEAFRQRKLDPGEAPSQSEVAKALGLKPEQVPHYERAISKKLARQMRDEGSQLSVAVAALRGGLGVLARRADLDHMLTEIDPLERAMPSHAPHRRGLLLLLAGLRVTDDWVIDVEIEEIIDSLLKGATEAGPATLDVVDRQLGRLGVRKELRLPWVVSRPGYRVAEQKLARAA